MDNGSVKSRSLNSPWAAYAPQEQLARELSDLEPLFFAFRGGEGSPIDYSFRLYAMVKDLEAGWQDMDGDVVIWHANGDTWRVAAVMRASMAGGCIVTWL